MNKRDNEKLEFIYPDKIPKTLIGGGIVVKEVTPKMQGQIHLPESAKKVKITHYIEDFVEEDLADHLKGKIKKGDKVAIKIYADEPIVAKRSTEENDLLFILVDQSRILAVY